MDELNKPAIGELHAFSKLLHQRLAEVPVGETVTYEQLSAAIGHDVQDGSRHHLHTARRLARKQDRMVFDVVVNVGLRRMNDAGTVGVVEGTVKRIRRAAKRGLDNLATVDLTKLTPAELTRAHITRAQIGVARVFTGGNTAKRLEAAAQSGALPGSGQIVGKALALFGGVLDKR